jgi:hypothetical protein
MALTTILDKKEGSMSTQLLTPPYTVSILHRSDPDWDGVSGILLDEYVSSSGDDLYAILRIPNSRRQQAGWYPLRVEPIQRALATGLVVTREDGWCRGFSFASGEAQCCESVEAACDIIEKCQKKQRTM